MVVSMPHAALWVVQPYGIENVSVRRECFNAARGFVGGAAFKMGAALQFSIVSMPHAALWVVQLCSQISSSVSATCFNAARGFVGGAASRSLLGFWVHTSFNAARGFVGGAA